LTNIITTTTTTAFSTTPTATFYSEDYERLGVGRSATKPEIKTAYYNKAKELHPDTNTSGSGDEVEFLKLTESYKRLMFDYSLEGNSRNDPRTREYWEMRRRHRSEEDLMRDAKRDEEDSLRNTAIVRKMAFALFLALLMGKVYPAMYLFSDEQSACSDKSCQKCRMSDDRRMITNLNLVKNS